MNPPSPKLELRRQLRAVRSTIAADPGERARRSSAIWRRVSAELEARCTGDIPVPAHEGSVPDAAGCRVMLFESLPTEPDTARWIDDVHDRGWHAFVPEVDGPDLRVVPGDLAPVELDVVIVPGVGFTADGGRLGQGGGHYDRFLPRLRPDCVTIGVCFREQLVDRLPIEPHDALVDLVVAY